MPPAWALENPLENPEGFLTKAAGLAFGYLLQDALDRYGATHPLTGVAGALTDTPPIGSIYNSEVVSLPPWSSTTRMAYNAVGLAIPGLLAGIAPEFFGFAFAAAFVRVLGGIVTSAVAGSQPTDPTMLQIYGDRIAAQNRLNQVLNTQMQAATAGTFAGVPRRPMGRPALPPSRQAPALPMRTLGQNNVAQLLQAPTSVMTTPGSPTQGVTGAQVTGQYGNVPLPGGAGGGCGCQKVAPTATSTALNTTPAPTVSAMATNGTTPSQTLNTIARTAVLTDPLAINSGFTTNLQFSDPSCFNPFLTGSCPGGVFTPSTGLSCADPANQASLIAQLQAAQASFDQATYTSIAAQLAPCMNVAQYTPPPPPAGPTVVPPPPQPPPTPVIVPPPVIVQTMPPPVVQTPAPTPTSTFVRNNPTTVPR